jgi:hypothetical protein
MQEEWMAKNKVKKYSGGGTLLNWSIINESNKW